MLGPFKAWARGRPGVAAVLGLAVAGGCSFVPKSKLDDYHKVTQTLRSDNDRLKDVALDLRAKNQDLSQRAVDDARRIAAQQEAVDRLEASVLAYQSERETLARAFETVRRKVHVSAAPGAAGSGPSASGDAPLGDFAGGRDGWAFDPKTGDASVPADRLFEPGKVALKPVGADDLKALAAVMKGSAVVGRTMDVIGHAGGPAPALDAGVRRTGAGVEAVADPGAGASARFLASARAAKVREALTGAGGLAPSAVRVAPPDASGGGPGTAGRIVVRVRTLDSAEATGR